MHYLYEFIRKFLSFSFFFLIEICLCVLLCPVLQIERDCYSYRWIHLSNEFDETGRPIKLILISYGSIISNSPSEKQQQQKTKTKQNKNKQKSRNVAVCLVASCTHSDWIPTLFRVFDLDLCGCVCRAGVRSPRKADRSRTERKEAHVCPNSPLLPWKRKS